MKKKISLASVSSYTELERLTRLVLLSAFALLMTVNVSKATPSTIIWIPSVDFQTYKTLHLGIDNYIRTEKDADGLRGAGVYDFGLTVGVSPFQKLQVEIGVDYLSMGDLVYDDHPLYFNGKIGTPESALFKGSPAIAIGAYNFGTKNNLTNYNIGYALIAKTLPIVGRLSVGYYIGNEKLLVNSKLDSEGKAIKDNKGIMASWDRSMKEISDKLWLAIDYQQGNNYLGALNVGFSWAFSSKVSVIFGYDIYNDNDVLYNFTDANKNTFTTQLDINF
jgi:hypothetical protein